MENENTNSFETPVSKSEFSGFWIPSHNAKVMKAGLDANKAPSLPDQNGNIKAEPVYTLSQGATAFPQAALSRFSLRR